MPNFRTELYAKWRACERFLLQPPGIKNNNWNTLDVWAQAKLIAYNQIRGYEEMKDQEMLYQVMGASIR